MLRAKAARAIRAALARRGLAIVGITSSEFVHLRRAQILADAHVSVVLDVGANVGGYGLHLREHGYQGRIVSFEPEAAAYAQLAQRAAGDPLWDCRRAAVDAHDGTLTLTRFANSEFNSVLTLETGSLAASGAPPVIGEEEVPAVRLDSLLGDAWTDDDVVALKVDVQGLEAPVLAGAYTLLEQTNVVEIELSAVSLYENQALLPELISLLYERGFVLASVRPITSLPNGYLLQADGIFVRPAPAAG